MKVKWYLFLFSPLLLVLAVSLLVVAIPFGTIYFLFSRFLDTVEYLIPKKKEIKKEWIHGELKKV